MFHVQNLITVMGVHLKFSAVLYSEKYSMWLRKEGWWTQNLIYLPFIIVPCNLKQYN